MKLGWPQIVYICLIMMNLGMYLVKHGEKNNTKYNIFCYSFFSTILIKGIHGRKGKIFL